MSASDPLHAKKGSEYASHVHPEGTFPAEGLLPKIDNGITAFLKSRPESDGRGVLVAIFDTGCDHRAPGLITTSQGKPKFIDFIDTSGSGDVDMSVKVRAQTDDDGCMYVQGLSGRRIKINPNWTNPSGEFRIGVRPAYTLFPDAVVSRVKEDRSQKLAKSHAMHEAALQAAIAAKSNGCAIPSATYQEGPGTCVAKTLDGRTYEELRVHYAEKTQSELEAELEARRKFAKTEDGGPLMDIVSWFDGKYWRAALDAEETADLSNAPGLAAYKHFYDVGVFSALTELSYSYNFYDDGAVVSIVVAAGSHGTHVAGIVGACFPDEPARNGAAPGCQMISVKIGDSALGTMETGPGLIRGVLAAIEHKVDLINMSYGEHTSHANAGAFIELAQRAVQEHGIIFVSSAGNEGPCLSTAGAPGGTTEHLISVGAFLTPRMVFPQYSFTAPVKNLGYNYFWSSRGPTSDGAMGVSISACGGAIASVPKWCLAHSTLMNGTSMSSPMACGGLATLVSGLKQSGIKYTPWRIKAAIEQTAWKTPDSEPHAIGAGMLDVSKAFDYITATAGVESANLHYRVREMASGARGVYIRDPEGYKTKRVVRVSVRQVLPEWASTADKTVGPLVYAPTYTNDDRSTMLQYITLTSSESWCKPAPYLTLSKDGAFSVEVDPTSLPPGAHLCEISATLVGEDFRGIHSELNHLPVPAPVLFRFPVTVIVPEPIPSPKPCACPPEFTVESKDVETTAAQLASSDSQVAHTYNYMATPICAGGFVTKYFAVPLGANTATVTVRLRRAEIPRSFFVHTLQVLPRMAPRHTNHSSMLVVEPGMKHDQTLSVFPGSILELRVTQNWSSLGDSLIDLTVAFHGVTVDGACSKNDILSIDDSEPNKRFYFASPLAVKKIEPKLSFKKLLRPVVPFGAYIAPLEDQRSRLPSGVSLFQLTLRYRYSTDKSTSSITVRPGLLHNQLYESPFMAQLWRVYDEKSKRYLGCGDAWPSSVSVPNSSTLIIELAVMLPEAKDLETLRTMPVYIEHSMSELKLKVRTALEGSSGSLSTNLAPGAMACGFITMPSEMPSEVRVGDVLMGKLTTFTTPADAGHINVRYVVTRTGGVSKKDIKYALPPSNADAIAPSKSDAMTASETKSGEDAANADSAKQKWDQASSGFLATYLANVDTLSPEEAYGAVEFVAKPQLGNDVVSKLELECAVLAACCRAAEGDAGAARVELVEEQANRIVTAIDEKDVAASLVLAQAAEGDDANAAKTTLKAAQAKADALRKAYRALLMAAFIRADTATSPETLDAALTLVKNVSEQLAKWSSKALTGSDKKDIEVSTNRILSGVVKLWLAVSRKQFASALSAAAALGDEHVNALDAAASNAQSRPFKYPVAYVLRSAVKALGTDTDGFVAPAFLSEPAAREVAILTARLAGILGMKEWQAVLRSKIALDFPPEFARHY